MQMSLESALRKRITGEVRFDAGSKAIYATDASNYSQVPIGVVIPRTIDDVVATVATAREFGAPILSRGAGTSIAGQCCNAAIVIDFSKYLNKIIEIDPEKRIACVQPGVVLDDLRDAAEKYGLTFGPDPATHKWCTLGGMIGNNSCGVHSIIAGRTVDNVEALDVLLYDGTRMNIKPLLFKEGAGGGYLQGREADIYEGLRIISNTYADEIRRTFPDIPRRVSGYSIDQLLPENGFNVARSLVGSEGTLVTILEATVTLIPSPQKRVLLVAGFEDLAVAGDHVPLVLEHKPIGLEGFDERFLLAVKTKGLRGKQFPDFPTGKGWLIVEFGANTTEDAHSIAEGCARAIKNVALASQIYEGEDQRAIWAVRDSALGAISRVPGQPDNWEGWEDSAVSPTKIGAYIRDLQKLLAEHGYSASMYGHIGDGCLHNRINWDPKSKEGIAQWMKFVDEAADLVISYGGSLSGEHGDGQARGALLPKMYGPKMMQAFEDFKQIWDPNWKMNPGKLIRPYRIDENLHYGADYHPLQVKTHFAFPDDEGSFSRAVERCVGAGVCRKDDGVMCPSYVATRDENDVTRGRAHALFEMMHGDHLTDGWKSEEVKHSLDLCLSCKACKNECPVRVDMATYKSEFLAHYYEGKIRPRAAYSMGLIYWAARMASLAPSIVNWLTHSPLTSDIVKWIGGIHPKRQIPRFAKETFKHWFFARPDINTFVAPASSPVPLPDLRGTGEDAGATEQKIIILWADTFNNHFRTETAKAAVKVLEDLGYTVKVYEKSMCCGRPLYDWGMLKQARKQLVEILDVVGPHVSMGIPIVVLEPSCASVFRDELRNLMPEREDAKQLAENVYLLSEFLEKFAPETPRATTGTSAMVQFHCHHTSILGKDAEESILKKSGVNAEILDAGCCGMAGAFGFETEHYDVSMKIAEHRVMSKLHAASKDRLILANGFSCREQIEQISGVKTLHLAEILLDSAERN
jgi:FAD/FMN-containing dehydrogenase/Fe-S oxidoreductase